MQLSRDIRTFFKYVFFCISHFFLVFWFALFFVARLIEVNCDPLCENQHYASLA